MIAIALIMAVIIHKGSSARYTIMNVLGAIELTMCFRPTNVTAKSIGAGG